MKHYLAGHFGIEQWADYTRGLLAGEGRTEMRLHLQNGCQSCRQLSEFTEKLGKICAGLAKLSVPESSVRLARSIFPVRFQERPKRGNRLPIELIFDSFLVPAPAGLRATWQVGWQGLYRAGDCSVDLRIEPELKSSRAAIIGQITNHVLPSMEMGNLPVSLKAGKLTVAETLSNRFGEFQLEYDQQARLKLRIDLRDSKNIQVPLRKMISDQPGAKIRPAAGKASSEKQ